MTKRKAADSGLSLASNYEARKFGVRSAMPSVTARRQFPDLVIVKLRFEVYKAISQQIREIFGEHPRSREPPTATGLPWSSGLSRCSTDA
jgi:DNA polymerase IV